MCARVPRRESNHSSTSCESHRSALPTRIAGGPSPRRRHARRQPTLTVSRSATCSVFSSSPGGFFAVRFRSATNIHLAHSEQAPAITPDRGIERVASPVTVAQRCACYGRKHYSIWVALGFVVCELARHDHGIGTVRAWWFFDRRQLASGCLLRIPPNDSQGLVTSFAKAEGCGRRLHRATVQMRNCACRRSPPARAKRRGGEVRAMPRRLDGWPPRIVQYCRTSVVRDYRAIDKRSVQHEHQRK